MASRTEDMSHTTGLISKPDELFTFGVLADVQYADADNGTNYEGSRHRYYRHSLDGLGRAVHAMMPASKSPTTNKSCDFMLQLGDLIDGKCRSMGKTNEAMSTVKSVLDKFTSPIYHVIGNHELYNFNKKEISMTYLAPPESYTRVADEKSLWFDIVVHPGYRLVVLNCYDVTVLGRRDNQTSPDYQTAAKIIRDVNHNPDWNASDDLPDYHRHYTAYNGGISRPQLQWLDQVLQDAERRKEIVILAGHIAVYDPRPMCSTVIWNYSEVLQVIHKYDCVVAYFAGHDHDGSYFQDEHGVHHIVMEAILETKPGDDAFGIVDVYRDKLVLSGHGRVPSRVLPFKAGYKES